VEEGEDSPIGKFFVGHHGGGTRHFGPGEGKLLPTSCGDANRAKECLREKGRNHGLVETIGGE